MSAGVGSSSGYVGNLITGASTLIGVALTLQYTRWQKRGEVREERRAEQRAAIVEVVVTGREWIRSHQGLLIMAAVEPDIVKLSQTSAMNQYAITQRDHQRALGAVRLILRDRDLRNAVEELWRESWDIPRDIYALQKSAGQQPSRKASASHYDEAQSSAARYAGLLEDLEELARKQLLPEEALTLRERLERRMLSRRRTLRGA